MVSSGRLCVCCGLCVLGSLGSISGLGPGRSVTTLLPWQSGPEQSLGSPFLPPSPVALRGRPCPLTSLLLPERNSTSSMSVCVCTRYICMLAQVCLYVCISVPWVSLGSVHIPPLAETQAGPKSLSHLLGPSSPVHQPRAGNSDPGPPRTQKPSPALTRRGSGLQRRTPV